MTKLEQLANEKLEVRSVLNALLGLYSEHNGCLWQIGTLYSRIQKKFRAAGPAGLNVKDFESETTSLKAQATRNSMVCYQIGIEYNKLRQLIGQNAAEVLDEKYQMLTLGELHTARLQRYLAKSRASGTEWRRWPSLSSMRS